MRGVLGASILVPFALGAASLRAQSYGLEEQTLTIGAAEFRANSVETRIDANGYLYNNGDGRHQAELALPVGALVERLCIFADDSDPTGYVDATLIIGKLVAPVGGDPDVDPVGELAASSLDVGYGYYCSDPFSYVLRPRADVDDDGIEDDVVYNVYVSVPPAGQNALGFAQKPVHAHRRHTRYLHSRIFPTESIINFIDFLAGSHPRVPECIREHEHASGSRRGSRETANR